MKFWEVLTKVRGNVHKYKQSWTGEAKKECGWCDLEGREGVDEGVMVRTEEVGTRKEETD